jgi:hypothetical protein
MEDEKACRMWAILTVNIPLLRSFLSKSREQRLDHYNYYFGLIQVARIIFIPQRNILL